MKATISQSLVSKLKPGERPFDVRDERLRGLLLRVEKSGSMIYYCEYARGRRQRIGLSTVLSPTEAREQAKQILADVAKGADPRAARKAKEQILFRDFIDKHYAKWAKANLKAHKSTITRLKVSFADFLDTPINKIKPLAVERWRSKRIEAGRAQSTVNRDLTALKAALARAVTWELLPEHPIASVKKAKEDKIGKVRFLSKDEEYRLRQALIDREARMREERKSANIWREQRGYPLLPDLDEAPFTDHLRPLVLLAMNTGMRRGELFDLSWENTDLEQALVTVTAATAKSKRTRHIPLNTEALETLQQWRDLVPMNYKLVFANEIGRRFDNVNSSWRKLLRDAKLENFRWHDLRHHFASKLTMAGVDLNTIRELLGHSDYAMTLRYAHLAPEHKRRAVELISQDCSAQN